jgi:hypothetical protein
MNALVPERAPSNPVLLRIFHRLSGFEVKAKELRFG